MGREVAGAALRQLIKDWPGILKQGEPACGDAVQNILGSTVETSIEIDVAAGAGLGVDVEGLSVTGATGGGPVPKEGLQKGDFIDTIAGKKPEDQDEAGKLVKQARESNQPYKVTATRRSMSPFVGLQKPLQLMYQDSNTPMKEVEEVMEDYGKLRLKASFVVDGLAPAAELKGQLDRFVADLEVYLSSGSTAAAPTKKAAGSSDLGDLFG